MTDSTFCNHSLLQSSSGWKNPWLCYHLDKVIAMAEYDLVLTNGRILDGCGNPWFRGDMAIKAGRIAALEPASSIHDCPTLDVGDDYIAPGFIDIHTHSDLSILVNRNAESTVRQGVTTQVIGNCGMSPAPLGVEHIADMRDYWGEIASQAEVTWEWRTFGDYLNFVQTNGISINIASLQGHAALRLAVMGFADRSPSSSELEKMKTLLNESMWSGAFGLSTGLVYPPGCFADTREIIELCEQVSNHEGFYASHIRGERETILEAVSEAIQIGREASLPVHISHNAPKFGAAHDAHANLGLVDEARSRGQDVTVDNDVHTDLGVALVHALPQRLQELQETQIQSMLRDPGIRRDLTAEIIQDAKPAFGPVGLLKHAQWQRITLFLVPGQQDLVGKSIAELAQERSQNPFEVYFDLIIANGNKVIAIFDYIDEKNIRLLLQHPAVMISSDGEALATHGFLNDPPPYSPCSYGEFPGVLERYVRDDPLLPLPEAIRKMTSFPAQRLGLIDRGRNLPGMWADLVVFDLDRLHDRATNLFPHHYPFVNYPHQYPQGIDYVFVNGSMVVNHEQHTGALPGQVLKHRSSLKAR